MSGSKRMSKGKKKTLSVLGVAGLSIVGTTAATTSETLAGLPLPASAQAFALAEEEISDVTLATFHVNKEAIDSSRSMLKHVWGCRGCGCRRCGGCGCRRCAGGCGCGGCGGCGGGGCCLSWGACRPWC
jgi:hypothetical protein